MEERKSKQVKMDAVKGSKDNNQSGRLTYEQLNDACSQLYQQNQALIKQLQQTNLANMFKRLDYLFMVLRYEAIIKDPDFVGSCIAEIKEAMTIDHSKSEDAKED